MHTKMMTCYLDGKGIYSESVYTTKRISNSSFYNFTRYVPNTPRLCVGGQKTRSFFVNTIKLFFLLLVSYT